MQLPSFAAIAAALSLVAAIAPAAAKPADCLFVFEGSTYIDGPCEMATADSGSFRVEADGYAVQLDVGGGNDPDKATGSWNGDVRASHLHQPLHGTGELSRDEACWSNDGVKLCVWKPDERTQKPAKLPKLEAREFGGGLDSIIGSWHLVAVAKNGKFDHCYASVLGDIDQQQGPLKIATTRDGNWLLSAPSTGLEPGHTQEVDVEYHKASGMLQGKIDDAGQRMNMRLGTDDLKSLIAGANISLGYAEGLVYQLKKTAKAVARLQDCRKQFLKKW